MRNGLADAEQGMVQPVGSTWKHASHAIGLNDLPEAYFHPKDGDH